LPDATQPWVTVATYGAVFEAEFAAATLQEAGIPARTTGAHVGIFGIGYQGPSHHGVEVQVPQQRADDAADLLASLEPDEHEPGDPDDPAATEERP